MAEQTPPSIAATAADPDLLAPVVAEPAKGDTYVWTMPDDAVVYVRVTRVHDGIAWLRCHHGGRSWTRRHQLPLFPSMEKREWTTAELLETIT